MAKIPNHLHRYKKVNLGRDGKEYFVYKCTKPVCPHYVPIELSLGKLCECNRCGEPMIIDKVTLGSSGGKALAKPHCNNCIKRKKPIEDVAVVAEYLSKILP